jgi:DNA-binding winged helix-turn-helix (wHTH) protein
MNVANVIPLSAPHAVPYAKSGDPAVLNPVRVRFDRFELDEVNARLLRDGTAVALAPTPFAVLCALVRQPGSLLTTNALLDDVWGHRFVTDSVLRTAISELRTALDDDARKPRFIETVSRRGYRFVAATIGASPQRAPAIERNVAAGRDHPALGVLTVLCRGDAALADLIRAVAATLEREPLVSTSPSRECVA